MMKDKAMRKGSMLAVMIAGLLISTAGSLATAQTPPVAKPVKTEPVTPLSDASARLGFDVLSEIAKAEGAGANPAVSPASIGAAFCLIDLGASPKLHAAMQKTLRLDAKKGADLVALRQSLAPLIAGGKADAPLTGISALYFDAHAAPKQSAVGLIRQLGAQVEIKDLSDPASIEAINALVKERTKGLIPSVLEQPLSKGGLVALNVLHFKDDWKAAFPPARTAETDFHLADGKTAKVAMMQGDPIPKPVREEGRFVAVELAYATKGYALIVITTKDKPATLSDFKPVSAWLTGEGFTERPATVALPRFALKTGGDLLDALDTLGLKPARLSPKALSQFSASAQVIDQIVQKIAITVDEKGTEAAAATAVTTTRSLGGGPPLLAFVADKPFVFALRDETSGQTLVTGYVADPSKAQ